MSKKAVIEQPVLTDVDKVQAKKEAFIRVVPQRVNNAIKAIRLVRQCASVNYSSSDEQKRAIVLALTNEVKELTASFEGKALAFGGFALPS